MLDVSVHIYWYLSILFIFFFEGKTRVSNESILDEVVRFKDIFINKLPRDPPANAEPSIAWCSANRSDAQLIFIFRYSFH